MSEPYDPRNNPYRARRYWPPDFSTMSTKQQFRLEKRYRRRAKLAYLQPGWMKATKIAQWSAISFVTIYAVIFMEWPGKEMTPVQGFRDWLHEKQASFWTQPVAPNLGRISDQPDKSS